MVVVKLRDGRSYLKHFYEVADSIHLISLNPVRRERPIHVTWDDIERVHVVLGIWFDSSS